MLTALLPEMSKRIPDTLQGIAGGILANQIEDFASESAHPPDLDRLVGHAIGDVLTRTAMDVHEDSQHHLVRSLGEWTPDYWTDVESEALSQEELVGAINERRGKRLGEVLSVEEWTEVIRALHKRYVEDKAFALQKTSVQGSFSSLTSKLYPRTEYERKVQRRRDQLVLRKQKLTPETEAAIAERLQDEFSEGLRDVLAADAANGGKAFGGIVIHILEDILTVTSRTLEEVQATGEGVRDLQDTQQQLLAQSNQILEELENDHSAVDSETMDTLRSAVGAVEEGAGLLRQISTELREGVYIYRRLHGGEQHDHDLQGHDLRASAAVPPETNSRHTPLSQLISDRGWAHDPWGELLATVNAQALQLYQEAVGAEKSTGEPDTGTPQIVSRRAWDPYLEDLKHWVEVRDEVSADPAHARATSLLLKAASSSAQSLRLWIVAEPGTGKTVLLYRTFFQVLQMRAREDTRLPHPMLIQPQLLRPDLIQRLNETPQAELLDALVQIWIENRSIDATDEERAILTKSLERHLDDGTVALFVDSFDELNRMQVQRHLVRGLFSRARRFVCASRTEAYRSVQGEWRLRSSEEIRLAPFWSLETIRNYLSTRFPGCDADIESFVKTVQSHEKAEHLRNARYLSLLVDLFQRGFGISGRPKAGSKESSGRSELSDFLSAVQYGEYELLTTLYDLVAENALRIAEGRGVQQEASSIRIRLRRAFEDIAKGQLRDGSFTVPMEVVDGHEGEVWTLVAGCKDFLRPLTRRGTEYQLRLKNFTLIDFFLTRLIADELQELDTDQALSFDHLWSSDLLMFLSSELRSRRPEQGVRAHCDRLWQRLDFLRMDPDALGPDDACRDAEIDENRQFQAINLLHLGIQLKQDNIDPHSRRSLEDVRASILLSRRPDLSDLYLEEADLSHLRFEECDFDRSVLQNANLEDAQFHDCRFQQSNLRQARAVFATFVDCAFDFHERAEARQLSDRAAAGSGADPPPSPVAGMLLHHARVEDVLSDDFGRNTFRKHGARMYGSRYAGPFGRKFLKKQAAFLGPGVKKALRAYIRTIKGAVSPQVPVCLVDLMAGGVSGLKEKLFKGTKNLQILAIDRDTHQLESLSDEIGRRYKVRQEEIEGRLGLSDLLSMYLDASGADIIIGKKALHELRREAQRALVRECAEVLRPGGSLILLADAPQTISPEAYDWLQKLAAPLRESLERGIVDWNVFQRRYIDRLTFTATEDDAAVFANLWVHLKDWANGNEHEVKHRYFSSAEEIRSWACTGTGLTEPDEHPPFHYTLASRRFNEKGFNWVGRHLDRQGGKIPRGHYGRVREHLLGGPRHELFYRFSDSHLWNEEQQAPTELGAFLNASTVQVSFADFAEDLCQIDLPPVYERVPAFEFDVHLLHFVKK